MRAYLDTAKANVIHPEDSSTFYVYVSSVCVKVIQTDVIHLQHFDMWHSDLKYIGVLYYCSCILQGTALTIFCISSLMTNSCMLMNVKLYIKVSNISMHFSATWPEWYYDITDITRSADVKQFLVFYSKTKNTYQLTKLDKILDSTYIRVNRLIGCVILAYISRLSQNLHLPQLSTAAFWLTELICVLKIKYYIVTATDFCISLYNIYVKLSLKYLNLTRSPYLEGNIEFWCRHNGILHTNCNAILTIVV